MRYSGLAYRYATALFDLAVEKGNDKSFLSALEIIQKTIASIPNAEEFTSSPLIRDQDKEDVVAKAFDGQGLPKEIVNFVSLLGRNGRLYLLPEIIAAFQAREDEVGKVTRGMVTSAAPLTAQQKDEVVKSITAVIKKKVELQYIEDKTLIGGLVAQVGGLTFDDSLSAHLRRMKEDLTRSIS